MFLTLPCVCDRSANTAPNSEVHPNAALAADGMLAETLHMAEVGVTRIPGYVSAAAMDSTPAECPQHTRRRGLTVADAAPAGFIPYANDGFVALPAEAVPLPSLRPAPSAHAITPPPCASATCATPLAPVPLRGPIPEPSPVPFPEKSPAPSALAQAPSQTSNRPPPPAPPPAPAPSRPSPWPRLRLRPRPSLSLRRRRPSSSPSKTART